MLYGARFAPFRKMPALSRRLAPCNIGECVGTEVRKINQRAADRHTCESGKVGGGFQTHPYIWIPGRATPDSDPGLPGMTTEFGCEFLTQDASVALPKIPHSVRDGSYFSGVT